MTEFVTQQYRTGMTHLNNVEIFNCSQFDTDRAAIRFDNNIYYDSGSFIEYSAIHHGLGWGMLVRNSHKVRATGNVFFDFSTIGVNVLSVWALQFNENHISKIWEREFSGSDGLLDKRAGLMVCQWDSADVCYDMKIHDNTVAGAPYAGFVVPGHDCG